MKNLESYSDLEIDTNEMKEIVGGGIIADFVEWFKCGCTSMGPTYCESINKY